jgi:hypothetical protein
MSRYIDSRHLETQFDEDTLYNGQEVLEVISEEPTADVKPVVHGTWIYTPHKRLVDETDEGPVYEIQEKCSCSVCGADFGFRKVEDNYCKYCGSQMDGE